jgi:hypothetical protein
MKKLTDALSGIKNIFSRKQNSDDAIPGCVDFKDAADKTRGCAKGWAVEGVHTRWYNPRERASCV